MKRLVMRSPFNIPLPKPKREGEATLLYPFDARIAWVAACHHRTASRISWDLFSSPAVRLEPLFEELLPGLTADDRLPAAARLRFSVDLGSAQDFEASPLQLRGVVKNAIVEALASRGVTAEIDADAPDVVFVVRRAGTPDSRRTVVGIDIGLGARHRRGARVAAGPAPLRETMAAQLVMLSRWDARSELLVDPMAGGGTIPIEAAGLAVGAAIRRPRRSAVPSPGGVRGFAAGGARSLSRNRSAHPGARHRRGAHPRDGRQPSRGRPDGPGPRGLDRHRADGRPRADAGLRGRDDPRPRTSMTGGVFCFNPPYGVRIGGEAGEENLLDLYADMGRALSRFTGWRAACFVANPAFRLCLRPLPDDDQAGDQRRAPRRVFHLPVLGRGDARASGASEPA